MVTIQTETQPPRLRQTHREKVLAHAARRLTGDNARAELLDISRLFRNFLKIEDRRLETALHMGATGYEAATARSFLLDVVVKRAYFEATRLSEQGVTQSSAKNGCVMVAMGGYGRGELAPYSDLDILFLHTGHRHAQVREFIEQLLRLLWDAGLTIGHSLQTVRECLASARTDAHLHTALVSTRLLAGDPQLYNSLQDGLERDRRKKSDQLLAAIQREHAARYARFGADVCLQEPNVKEGAGGIRDLHTALWTAHARYGCRNLEELRTRELISKDEREVVTRAYDFLWRVRYSTHLLTHRKTERLALDIQPALAEAFGYRQGNYLLASEKFMRDYYRHARELHLFSKSLCERAAEPEPKEPRWWTRRGAQSKIEPLSISDGRLQLEGSPQLFTENPLRLFDAFALAQAAGVPFGTGLRDAIRANLSLVNHKLRSSVEAADAFLKLLRRRGRVGHALRLMHEVGFLSRFMPEFGRISLLIQHDLYHHYTVDEHTLKAIEALDELHTSQDKQRAHLRVISDEVEDQALLYLSLLLHDIGKGRGRGHIPRGARIAERICRRLSLNDGDREKVVLMVRQHVAMAHLAQRRDLHEPQVAADFAAQLGGLDALNMLLLLTYADLKSVAPGVWSEWKSTLLWELYRRTRTAMTGSDAPPDEVEKLARFKEQVVCALEGTLPISEVERHFALLPDRYVRVTSPEAAATHLHLIEELKTDIFARRWLRHGRSSTELTICTRDRQGLFADIAGTLAAHGIEILSAELNTREDGVALDVFMLREASTHHAIDMHRHAAIERALRKAIAGEADTAALVERWQTKNAPRKRAAITTHARRRELPRVACDNESARSSTLVEVHAVDEPGLAHKIASVMAGLGLNIACAKIATEKSDALDVFYVTDEKGMKLSESRMQAVVHLLELSLTGTAARMPELQSIQEKTR
ncbi:MAG TPA: [protein-PII] uridylyltransferase [Pyrinomonadaceae bacterium]|jgi:[protein-PII] uridylyltransferase